jgi:hypothetical protein
MGPSLSESVTASLEVALSNSELPPDKVLAALKAGQRFSLDVYKLVVAFKDRWLYQNYVPHPIRYDIFSGSALLLMYKNLGVTNLWPTELLALLRTYSFEANPDSDGVHSKAYVSFSSDLEYTSYLEELFNSISRSVTSNTGIFDHRAFERFIVAGISQYADIINSTIVINFYYCSALVHVPRNRVINLRRIIAESGYIHSGGTAIYVRAASKAKIEELEDRLMLFLNGYSDKPVYITPYADEFFSPYDSVSPVSIRNGLADVKLQLRKHFIGGIPLLEYLATLPTREGFKDKIHVPLGLADYAEERHAADKTESRSTIWFIVDHGLDTRGLTDRVSPSQQNLYLMVYTQAFLNDNQFILLKERKPGWYASITQPHTMSAAIVNILRGGPFVQNYGSTKPRVVLDPFFGTGTTIFDAALRLDDAVIIGFDRDPRSFQAVLDNSDFFSLSPESLEHYMELIDAGLHLLTEPDFRLQALPRNTITAPKETASHTEIFRFILSTINKSFLLPNSGEQTSIGQRIRRCVTEGFDDELNRLVFGDQSTLKIRIVFYLLWRAMALGGFGIRDNAENVPVVFKQELEKFRSEIRHMRRGLVGNPIYPQVQESFGLFAENVGLYSHALYVNPSSLALIRNRIRQLSLDEMEKKGSVRDWEPGIWLVRTPDSLSALKLVANSVDLLLTDPPYGFNAQEDEELELMDCYGQLAPLLVDALTDTGQLALILPAFAKNGREIPFYQTSRSITRQVITHAKRSQKPLSDDVKTIPQPYQLFTRPYYWISTSVLERSIIHFRAAKIDKP